MRGGNDQATIRHGEQFISSAIAARGAFWWNERKPDQPSLWESKSELGEDFFNEIIRCPIPLDLNTLRAMKRSPLGLDLYLWLTYRTFTLKRPLRLTWPLLYRQFGVNPAKATDQGTVDNFRRDCLRELHKIKRAWPDLHYHTVTGALVLSPSPPQLCASSNSPQRPQGPTSCIRRLVRVSALSSSAPEM